MDELIVSGMGWRAVIRIQALLDLSPGNPRGEPLGGLKYQHVGASFQH